MNGKRFLQGMGFGVAMIAASMAVGTQQVKAAAEPGVVTMTVTAKNACKLQTGAKGKRCCSPL